VKILGALICIGAGLYLLSAQTVADDSFLEVIAHGMGVYFIGKGLFIWALLDRQDEHLVALRRLVAPQEETEASPPSRDGIPDDIPRPSWSFWTRPSTLSVVLVVTVIAALAIVASARSGF
jgi:hypothetical protein